MNENMPATEETSALTSVSQSSNTNDIVDLIEINDDDESEVTSSSVIVSNYSINPQQPGSNLGRTRRKITKVSPSKECSDSADDSICILYENIQPAPDIVVVNEVIIGDNEENESANDDYYSIPMSPVIMGPYTENPVSMYQQIPPLFPELSNEMTSSSSLPIDYSFDSTRAYHHSSLPSCQYARSHPPESAVPPYQTTLQRAPLPTTRLPLNMKTVLDNVPNHGSEQEKRNIVIPKIQCGICLDGPDEIATSDRNFTSTNCGHIFCNVCIKTSMKNAAKCPKCRKKVTSRQIHPLYL